MDNHCPVWAHPIDKAYTFFFFFCSYYYQSRTITRLQEMKISITMLLLLSTKVKQIVLRMLFVVLPHLLSTACTHSTRPLIESKLLSCLARTRKKRWIKLKKNPVLIGWWWVQNYKLHNSQDENSGWCSYIHHWTCLSLIPNHTLNVIFWLKNRPFT